MKSLVKYASVVALAAASMGTASANTYVFDFYGNDNSNTFGAAGNARTVAASNSPAISVRATGWNASGASVLAGYLGAYSQGLGVMGSQADQHFIDNYGNVDFVLLQFSKPVTLTSGIFNAYFIAGAGTPRDSDASLAVGSTAPGSWTSNLFASGTSAATVASLFSGGFQSNVAANSGAPRALNPGGLTGNLWAIAAGGADGNFDGFKIAQLTVSAVPEPATWAMMILGMGAVGFAMRSRRAKATKVSYAF